MRIVGRYAIYDEIASGGMASVHFARLVGPSGFARVVAVKRMHPHLAREADFVHMFLDEARTASRIHHSNVVATLDVVEALPELLLVMDYVHGESVYNLARASAERGERVPPGIAASIVVDTLHGLHAAHEARGESGEPLAIVHRDVSPQNVLVGADGVSRLVDFGIAKAAGRLHTTRDSSVKGKYAYMAPEQVRGEEVSRMTDTYAAGVVLWELLTGERLFAGKTEAETIHKCLVGRVQPPSLLAPELGRAFDDLVKQALSRDPSRRFATAREMALAVEACAPPARPPEVGAWVERVAGERLAVRARVLAEIERDEPHAAPEIAAPSSGRATATAPREARRARRVALLVAISTAVVLGVVAFAVLPWRGAPAATAARPTASESTSAPAPPALDAAASVATPSTLVAPSVAPPLPAPPPAASRAHPPRPGPARASPTKRPDCDPPYSIDSAGRQIFKPECM